MRLIVSTCFIGADYRPDPGDLLCDLLDAASSQDAKTGYDGGAIRNRKNTGDERARSRMTCREKSVLVGL